VLEKSCDIQPMGHARDEVEGRETAISESMWGCATSEEEGDEGRGRDERGEVKRCPASYEDPSSAGVRSKNTAAHLYPYLLFGQSPVPSGSQ